MPKSSFLKIQQRFPTSLIDKDELFSFVKEESKSSDIKTYHLLEGMISHHFLYKYNNKYYKYYGNKHPFENNMLSSDYSSFEYVKEHIEISSWDTIILNRFLSKLHFEHLVLYECLKKDVLFVIETLRKNHKNAIYYKDLKRVPSYFLNDKNLIIVKPYNSDTPLIRSKKKENRVTFIPVKLEKILVDIILDDYLYERFQDEIEEIYLNALKKHPINISTLLRYASKRKRKDDIMDVLKKISFDIDKGEFMS